MVHGHVWLRIQPKTAAILRNLRIQQLRRHKLTAETDGTRQREIIRRWTAHGFAAFASSSATLSKP
jgi:hypothetical protein